MLKSNKIFLLLCGGMFFSCASTNDETIDFKTNHFRFHENFQQSIHEFSDTIQFLDTTNYTQITSSFIQSSRISVDNCIINDHTFLVIDAMNNAIDSIALFQFPENKKEVEEQTEILASKHQSYLDRIRE